MPDFARRCAVFDLDGTLVDSAPDIHAALDRLMARRRLPGFARAEVVGMIGDGVRVLLERAHAARGITLDEASFDHFMTDYEANAAVLTQPFAGIPELLSALQASGWRLAVCTNKPEAAARVLLSGLGLDRHFSALGGGDSFPMRKPDPGHLRATLAAAGAAPDQAVMIGDHANDMLAARGAGVRAIFAGWGYGPQSMAGGAPIALDVAGLRSLLG
ncbi:MAG: phosphoglycolate phosphatase [Roseomonas sp.]|nr:phosphoglycolate phosphatase [Roseomonas sp.]MCA3430564.1 phosphoglycolate phosphatase [Roseomonas sp.]MCA3434553.1 phosphoglycolate phosphatase [Roseomonas sp.]